MHVSLAHLLLQLALCEQVHAYCPSDRWLVFASGTCVVWWVTYRRLRCKISSDPTTTCWPRSGRRGLLQKKLSTARFSFGDPWIDPVTRKYTFWGWLKLRSVVPVWPTSVGLPRLARQGGAGRGNSFARVPLPEDERVLDGRLGDADRGRLSHIDVAESA